MDSNSNYGIDEHKLKYVGYCGCCQKDWESIKEMTDHVLRREELKIRLDLQAARRALTWYLVGE